MPEAREITLRSLKPLAPPFHRHIVKGKLKGQACAAGDRVVIYEITSTDPPGRVLVTPSTIFVFS